MCRNAIFNTGKVSLSASDRQDICKLLGISPQTLTNCLTLLKEKKLIDGDKGSYTINPNIYWKGDLKSRNAILNTEEIQVAFTVSIPDVKIQDSNDAI